MPDSKLSNLPSLSSVQGGDQVYINDVSDTTDDPAGTSKRITLADLGAKVLIQTIDLSTPAAEADFNSIPQIFNRLFIIGQLRTNAAATGDYIICFVNEDVTAANYFSTNTYGFDATTTTAEIADARVGYAPGNTAPANAFGTLHAHYESYALSGRLKSCMCRSEAYSVAAGQSYNFMTSNTAKLITDPITRLRVRAKVGTTLAGILRLYGEI